MGFSKNILIKLVLEDHGRGNNFDVVARCCGRELNVNLSTLIYVQLAATGSR